MKLLYQYSVYEHEGTIHTEVEIAATGTIQTTPLSKEKPFKRTAGLPLAVHVKLLEGSQVLTNTVMAVDPQPVLVPLTGEPAVVKSCDNCGNKCMDMDLDPYCAAVNPPWGQTLRKKPEECGPESKLWIKDERRRGT